MAERIGQYCWSTPKCGISTAERWFIPPDYKFIIVRNPYHRMVSFYINKVVYQGVPPRKLDEYDWETITEIAIPHMEGPFGKHRAYGTTDMSFRQFLKLVEKMDVNDYLVTERHLLAQHVGVDEIKFNKIVRCETFKEDMKEVCDVLHMDYKKITNKKENHFNRSTSRSKKKVCDQPTAWFRKNGIPKDYRRFYDKELEDLVWVKYKRDFELFQYERGDI